MAPLPTGDGIESPTLRLLETQLSPSAPLNASPILLVTLPGMKKKKNAFALLAQKASTKGSRYASLFMGWTVRGGDAELS